MVSVPGGGEVLIALGCGWNYLPRVDFEHEKANVQTKKSAERKKAKKYIAGTQTGNDSYLNQNDQRKNRNYKKNQQSIPY